jgi:alcohol dehydrogenase
MTYGKETVCSICHGEVGPDVNGRIMCYGCGPDELLPQEKRTRRPAQAVRPRSMKALVYRGPGKRKVEERPLPVLQKPTDAIVRILCTTICGTDLHILEGDVPEVVDGRILGHEGVGVVEQVGAGVTTFAKGDHVLISCITSCGKCGACKRGMYSHCESGGGWILGHLIDGTQAEYLRVPFADTSLHQVPRGVDEEALVLLSDVFPTGFECGVESGAVKMGDTVAIVGAGPIGLAALLTAQLHSPAQIIVVDVDDGRLEVAKSLGATAAHTAEEVRRLTGGRGVDVAIEAVGIPGTFELCEEIVAAGGHIANVGVHGKPCLLHLEKLWAHNITITTRLVDTAATPMLLRAVQAGKLQPRRLVTHTFGFDQIEQAYATFESRRSLKVLIKSG